MQVLVNVVKPEPFQLRAWHPKGVSVWDVSSVENGWKLWANFTKKDGYYTANTTVVKVVPSGTPL